MLKLYCYKKDIFILPKKKKWQLFNTQIILQRKQKKLSKNHINNFYFSFFRGWISTAWVQNYFRTRAPSIMTFILHILNVTLAIYFRFQRLEKIRRGVKIVNLSYRHPGAMTQINKVASLLKALKAKKIQWMICITHCIVQRAVHILCQSCYSSTINTKSI